MSVFGHDRVFGFAQDYSEVGLIVPVPQQIVNRGSGVIQDANVSGSGNLCNKVLHNLLVGLSFCEHVHMIEVPNS